MPVWSANSLGPLLGVCGEAVLKRFRKCYNRIRRSKSEKSFS